MGASAWSYTVPYQPDLNAALRALREKVFNEGNYHWVRGEFGTSASDYDNRPRTMDELFGDEWVQESGTHSILDMWKVLRPGEDPDYGTCEPVSPEEAVRCAGTEKLTRAHIPLIDDLVTQRWFGRCAILHDDDGHPAEIYFWGYSGD